MKKNIFIMLSLVLALGILLTGCKNSAGKDSPGTAENNGNGDNHNFSAQSEENYGSTAGSNTKKATELVVRFGDGGKPFTMHLYDNDTAAAIARHVGTSDWRLPIYHYNDYENWEVMQYYDVPNRYKIPSAPERVTKEKAGAVYYSEPNRIILYYQDAEVPADYTPVGYFDYTDEFLKAVQENPVLEGWGNKIVNISDGK